MSKCRITVLISGSGSNLQALIDARDRGELDAELVHVISNRADAFGLQRAAAAGIPSSLLPHQDFTSREDFDRALALLIAARQPDLIILAGFMRILGAAAIEPYQGRMINLHPSLLPLYPGTHTYERAIAAGDRQHGASLHFVNGELDGGPLISQVRIPIAETDTPEQLAGRLAPREHDLIVATSRLFCQHVLGYSNGQVLYQGRALQKPLELQADGSFLE
ncbi:MAG TPA: phosphoribosylglycinamide formyltransferase [Xanthomonadales bacterium]|nr:phosphoribosylglycinamide formyltransferase [Xanthomonadales bacterium]